MAISRESDLPADSSPEASAKAGRKPDEVEAAARVQRAAEAASLTIRNPVRATRLCAALRARGVAVAPQSDASNTVAEVVAHQVRALRADHE